MHTTYEVLPMNSYPIRIQRFVNHRSRGHIHWHEEIELLYFTEGEGIVLCDLQEYSVRCGDIVFVNGKELHTGCIRGENAVYYCIQVNTDFFHNLVGSEYVIFQHVIRDRACSELLDRILRESRIGAFEHVISVKAMIYELFARLAREHVAEVLSGDDYQKQFKRLDTVNSIIEYIDRHYEEELTVSALAKQFYMSASYFAHLFKWRTQKSVTCYINEVRIAHAKAFLEMEELPIGTIAGRVGFNDINYFSRKFKALVGMTPGEYRRSKAIMPKNID